MSRIVAAAMAIGSLFVSAQAFAVQDTIALSDVRIVDQTPSGIMTIQAESLTWFENGAPGRTYSRGKLTVVGQNAVMTQCHAAALTALGNFVFVIETVQNVRVGRTNDGWPLLNANDIAVCRAQRRNL